MNCFFLNLLCSPLPMAGTKPSLHATCGLSGPSHCRGKQVPLGRGGLTWDACIIDHLAFPTPSPPPQNQKHPGLCDSLSCPPLLVKNHIV
uniref:Secreted protein n=1 Tax=Equus asinus TaxID=9793 RepID=A0A8C4MRN0_EQUAS